MAASSVAVAAVLYRCRMYLKVSKSRSNGKSYQYGQLVESYRRKTDGKPTIRVIASLGRLSDIEIQNFRAAIAASRDGDLVQVQKIADQFPVVRDNLRYLDLAVIHEVWEESGLGKVIDDATQSVTVEVPVSKMVEALVMHRILAGGSKLHAERWFPTTVMSVLLGVQPEKLNNSRIHRTLSVLDGLEENLQRGIADHVQGQRGGRFVTLFVDSTDTWFVGDGPEMAHVGLIKEGLFKEKVGIALVCDDLGFPLHWETYAGNVSETKPMMRLMEKASAKAWGRGVPIVADRALGSAAFVGQMLDKGIPFVTATRRSEFDAYTSDSDLEIPQLPPTLSVEDAKASLLASGFRALPDGSYLRDVGIIERSRTTTDHGLSAENELCHSAHYMRLALQFNAAIESGEARSGRQLAKMLGMAQPYISRVRRLADLPDYICHGIALGSTPTARTQDLYALLELEPDAVHEAYLRLTTASGPPVPLSSRRTPLRDDIVYVAPGIQVQGVLAFNPDVFLKRRETAQDQVDEVLSLAADINRRLLKQDRTDEAILSELGALLRRRSLLTLFDLKVVREPSKPAVVHATIDQEAWRLRRRHDGLFLVIGNPVTGYTGEALLQAYRAKNVVETNFQEIKSVLNLRPVRHRTDPKVRAHVTLCILALHIERLLEEKLRQAHHPQTASSAMEVLSTCHLNEVAITRSSTVDTALTVTQPNVEQQRLLEALQMTHLTDNERLLERLHLQP